MWWLLLLPFSALAQVDEEIDLEMIRLLDQQLPSQNIVEGEETKKIRQNRSRYRHPYRSVSLEEILESDIEYGHIQAGKTIIRLKDNKSFKISESIYAKFYRLEDEQGFKYLQSQDGRCDYKIASKNFIAIKSELELYEPPLRYTPAPTNIVRTHFDKKFQFDPQIGFYAGVVQGTFIKDLFNDKSSVIGLSQQYTLHLNTNWKLPVKVGGVFHYERTTYSLSGGGKVYYASPSFGPQFKSRNFDLNGSPLRIMTQFRISPFARAAAETVNGNVNFKFNSADFLLGFEHPVQNSLGEFVIGLFYQRQWLNLKDQPEVVSIRASNKTNEAFGLSLGQVF